MNETAILLTATVAPHNIPYLSLTNVEERLSDYLCSMYCYIKFTKVKKIVFCDNSGFKFDYSKIVNLAYEHGKTLEVLTYDDNKNASIFGKGYGEGEIIEYALKNSKVLQNTPTFYKCTGRLFFPSFDLIEEKHRNEDLVFNINKEHKMAYTRLFKCTKELFYKYIQSAYKKADDSKDIILEQTCFEALSGLNLSQMEYGLTIGRAGGRGNIYDGYFNNEIIQKAEEILNHQ